MRRNLALVGLLLVAACSKSLPDGNNTTTPVSTVDLLKSGSDQACSQQDVRDTLLSQVKPNDGDHGLNDAGDFQNGQADVSYTIDTISLAATDRNINSVTCDANLIVHYKDHEDKTFSVRYELRPSVEDREAFILHGDVSDAHQYAVNVAQDAASNIALARSRAQQEVQQRAQEQAQALQQQNVSQDPGEADAPAPGDGAQNPPPPTNLLPQGSPQ